MTITPATSSTSVIAASKYTGPVMDMDVHETFTSWQDLIPYLEAGSRVRITSYCPFRGLRGTVQAVDTIAHLAGMHW